MGGTATLVVRRLKTPWRDRLARYSVLLDEEVIGSIKNGKVVTFAIDPGQHRLRLRVVGKYSPELLIVLAAAEVAAFDCGPVGSTFSALYPSIFRRQAYMYLRPAS